MTDTTPKGNHRRCAVLGTGEYANEMYNLGADYQIKKSARECISCRPTCRKVDARTANSAKIGLPI